MERGKLDSDEKCAVTVFTTPGVGQIAGAVAGGFVAGATVADVIDDLDLNKAIDIPLKAIGGAVGGIVGAAGGAVASIPLMPISLYY